MNPEIFKKNMGEQEGQEPQTPEALYYGWVENYVKNKHRSIDSIPPEQRTLEQIGNYGYHMRIKQVADIPASSAVDPAFKDTNRSRVDEYFFDFDDTLFDTTGYNNAIWDGLEALGINRPIIVETYERSKVPNDITGEKMYRQELFIQNLIALLPDQAPAIQEIFSGTSYDGFVHEDMAHLLRLLTTTKTSRVHILTYGDIATQQKKVEAVLRQYGVPMDVLYAQVPKATFLSNYLPEQYPYVQEGSANCQNFIVVDDSTSELEQLMNISKRIPFLVPLRLRKPEAKKSKDEQKGERTYEISQQHELILREVIQSLHELRNLGHMTQQEWSKQNLSQRIKKSVDQEKSSPEQIQIRNGNDGTLILSHHVRELPDSEDFADFETEVLFDQSTGAFYELERDADGHIKNKKECMPGFVPLYSDII